MMKLNITMIEAASIRSQGTVGDMDTILTRLDNIERENADMKQGLKMLNMTMIEAASIRSQGTVDMDTIKTRLDNITGFMNGPEDVPNLKQCTSYNVLSDESRHHSTGPNTPKGTSECDKVGSSHTSIDWKGPGWYRVTDETHGSTRLASNSEVTIAGKCGAIAPGYLKSTVNPEVGETKDATVCFWARGDKCWRSSYIKVTNCGDFLVYDLPDTQYCNYRYCIGP